MFTSLRDITQGRWGGRFNRATEEYIGRTEEVVRVHGLARWPGDSIIAWGRSREFGYGISVHDTQGNYGRTFTFVDEEHWFAPEYVTRDGLIVATYASDYTDTTVVQIRDAEGGLRSSLGTHPSLELYIVDEGTDQETLVEKIFGRRSVRALWGDPGRHRHDEPVRTEGFRVGWLTGANRQTGPWNAGARPP